MDHSEIATRRDATKPRRGHRLDRLLGDPAVLRSLDHIEATDALTVADQVEVARIPAPPYGEAARSEWLAGRLRGLDVDVTTDAVGNLIARLPCADADAAPVLLSAHLDTVFEADVDIRIEEDPRGRWVGPGIADDARGLAAVLAIARSIRAAGLRPAAPLVLVATVGEEGRSDLRGARHLFREGGGWRDSAAFITLDGGGLSRIVNKALGSRRLRITASGPGGHSWADWGVANPITTLASAIAALDDLALPRHPRTTLSPGRIEGGTAVNAIPQSVTLELDLRSEDAAALEELERHVGLILERAIRDGNARRPEATPALSLDVQVIGDRPAGGLKGSSRLVRAAVAATRWARVEPRLVTSSTDANVPLSLGIPAIGLGAGGKAGSAHTTREWYSNQDGPLGIQRALLTALQMTGPPPTPNS